jgi:hypothetical protein
LQTADSSRGGTAAAPLGLLFGSAAAKFLLPSAVSKLPSFPGQIEVVEQVYYKKHFRKSSDLPF